MFFGGLRYPGNPIAGEWALIGIVKNEACPVYPGVPGAIGESGRLRIFCKGKIHQIDPTVGYVPNLEALVGQKLWIG